MADGSNNTTMDSEIEGRNRNMMFRNIIEKLRGIATEANDYEDVNTNIVIIRNSDGTYTEVTSDEDA